MTARLQGDDKAPLANFSPAGLWHYDHQRPQDQKFFGYFFSKK
jgi:hypothetical protein